MTEKPENYEAISDVESPLEMPEKGSEQPTEPSEGKALTPYDQMAAEWRLSPEELSVLVRPPTDGGPITLPMVKRLLAASKMYAVPISSLMEIKDKKGRINIYFTADAIRWRVFTDPRSMSSSHTELVHMPDMEQDKDYIAVKATITMKDGSVGEGWGISEWPPGGHNATLGLGDLVMKLETKATRRAGIKLVGANLPVLDEEFYAWQTSHGNTIEGEYKEIEAPKKPKKEKPSNLAELLPMALTIDKELTPEYLVEMMSLNAITELNSCIDDVWERIQEYASTKVSGRDTGEAEEEAPEHQI